MASLKSRLGADKPPARSAAVTTRAQAARVALAETRNGFSDARALAFSQFELWPEKLREQYSRDPEGALNSAGLIVITAVETVFSVVHAFAGNVESAASEPDPDQEEPAPRVVRMSDVEPEGGIEVDLPEDEPEISGPTRHEIGPEEAQEGGTAVCSELSRLLEEKIHPGHVNAALKFGATSQKEVWVKLAEWANGLVQDDVPWTVQLTRAMHDHYTAEQ